MVTMSRCIINEHLQKLLVSYFHVSVFASALGYRCMPSLLFNIIFYLMNIGSMWLLCFIFKLSSVFKPFHFFDLLSQIMLNKTLVLLLHLDVLHVVFCCLIVDINFFVC